MKARTKCINCCFLLRVININVCFRIASKTSIFTVPACIKGLEEAYVELKISDTGGLWRGESVLD